MVVVILRIQILHREEKRAIFAMELKSVGLVEVIKHTETHLQTKKWLVQIAPMVGAANVMALEDYKFKGGSQYCTSTFLYKRHNNQ